MKNGIKIQSLVDHCGKTIEPGTIFRFYGETKKYEYIGTDTKKVLNTIFEYAVLRETETTGICLLHISVFLMTKKEIEK